MLWGAYNGLFLTLDRLFLRKLLDRCGTFISTIVTLFIVMIGWAIFRSEPPAHLGLGLHRLDLRLRAALLVPVAGGGRRGSGGRGGSGSSGGGQTKTRRRRGAKKT